MSSAVPIALIAAAMLRAVVACNPGAALGAFPVADRQPLGDRAPVGLPPRLEPQRGTRACRALYHEESVPSISPLKCSRRKRTANVRHRCSWTGADAQGQKMPLLQHYPNMRWTGVDAVSSLSRRKHGFDSRRARQLRLRCGRNATLPNKPSWPSPESFVFQRPARRFSRAVAFALQPFSPAGAMLSSVSQRAHR